MKTKVWLHYKPDEKSSLILLHSHMVRMVQLLLRKLHLEADWIKCFLYFNATLKKKKTNLNGGQSNKVLNELMWLQYQNYTCSSGCHRISTATIMSQTSHRYKACLKETKQYWKVDLIRWIYGPNTTIHNKKKGNDTGHCWYCLLFSGMTPGMMPAHLHWRLGYPSKDCWSFL